jgi:hypothetical protein
MLAVDDSISSSLRRTRASAGSAVVASRRARSMSSVFAVPRASALAGRS